VIRSSWLISQLVFNFDPIISKLSLLLLVFPALDVPDLADVSAGIDLGLYLIVAHLTVYFFDAGEVGSFETHRISSNMAVQGVWS
jgi:hypothetical protein